MLNRALAASFDLIWEVENKPYVDVLKYILNNNPNAISNRQSTQPYVPVQSDIRCIFAGGPQDGDIEDDTTRYDLTLFMKEDELDTVPNHKLIFRYEERLYKLVEKDPNMIFGLVEFNLMRAD